ncbi:uncharacterized protein LOC123533396 [Mercenaria mercenaria]|uniref:uncharacterized protein LOC123533396 n=1 Tax=Mercenaria mercenaria TaxID=6596 RepID=UPI00234E605A|nr:uncharacterized protein LOC123533396 [Mercenaria mercenaria]
MAKSRVAPLKKITLPNLELMAAVIGARLARHILQAIDIQDVILWSDSQSVLHWLSTSRPVNKFVQNRVTEIRDLTQNRKLKYCPTKHNPADLLTRGITASQFRNNHLWMHGPDWLTYQTQWPVWMQADTITMVTLTDETQETDEHPFPRSLLQDSLHVLIDLSRYNSYRKLIRVTAYVLRFINNCRAVTIRRRDPLNVTELQNAEHRWLQNCQHTEYAREISSLKTSEKRLPIVRQLKLFLDDRGDLRCGGRIQNAPLEYAITFPYLLPPKHTRHLHTGENAIITYLRQKYWIPSIRRCVQTEIRKCVTCKRINGKQYPAPDPPPLPKFRLEDSAPFTVTGVDFTGALHVKDQRGNMSKEYICLFTCASTRALHLEVVQNLTEISFMQAFRRFCSRKSLPHIMVSDNAATYQAASRHLRQLFYSQSMKEALNQEGTQWYFIPARAQWYGGWWERLIGLTKITLKKVFGRGCINLEELQTITTEVEAVLNDRPITYVTSDDSDPHPLTPAHLLYGRQVKSLPTKNVPIESVSDPAVGNRSSITRRARVQKELIEHFRERWRHEYLTALREYHRVTGNNKQTISVGDVIQIHDDTPRARWRLGVVHELIYGKDGLIRAAKVKSNSGISVRPIIKLYPLETK